MTNLTRVDLLEVGLGERLVQFFFTNHILKIFCSHKFLMKITYIKHEVAQSRSFSSFDFTNHLLQLATFGQLQNKVEILRSLNEIL